MRRITDRGGRTWDVVVGRESFGALFALFIPAGDNPGPPRQTMLGASSPIEAEGELTGLTTSELARLLDRSVPKDDAQ